MTEIKRIGVLSLAKIVGFLYFALGLVGTVFFGCFALIGLSTESMIGVEGASAFVFLCFLPLLYGIIGFIGGGIIGLIYNAIAPRFGGIELQLSGIGRGTFDMPTTNQTTLRDTEPDQGITSIS